jgi:hypothetical protein
MTLRKSWIVGAAGLALVAAYSGARAQDEALRQPTQQPAQTRTQTPPQTQAQASPQTQTQAPRTGEGRIDPRATEVVRRMSSYLSALPAFSVKADTMTEVVTPEGQKIQTLLSSDLALQRPNKLRSERRGPSAHATLVYDGDKLMLRGHRTNAYALTDAPNDLDAALDFARDELGVEAPGADLLYSDVYEGLMRNAQSGQYLGQVEVNGVLTDHVAFRAGRADFQLWVQRGNQPLPLRYVITTTDQAARPEFVVELHDWNMNPRLSASAFATTPPSNAQRIDFDEVLERAAAARPGAQQPGTPRGGK